MTGRIEENRPNNYVEFIAQMGYNPKLSSELTQRFLDLKAGCTQALGEMQDLVRALNPTPDYRVWSGASWQTKGQYLYHSGERKSLVGASVQMIQAKGDGWFTGDSNNKLILAEPDSLIPVVQKFTPVIEVAEAYRLPEDHPAVLLCSVTYEVVRKIKNEGGFYEFILFMLAEGFNEKISDISELLPPSTTK